MTQRVLRLGYIETKPLQYRQGDGIRALVRAGSSGKAQPAVATKPGSRLDFPKLAQLCCLFLHASVHAGA